MKQLLKFFMATKNGEKIFLTLSKLMFISLIIGLILSAPVFWMSNAYEDTWMNVVAPYFFILFFGYAASVVFLFIPYLWFVSTSEHYQGNSRKILKVMAIAVSIIPGGFIYGLIANQLFIQNGLHNLAIALIIGYMYLFAMKTIFRKTFTVIQSFIPLS